MPDNRFFTDEDFVLHKPVHLKEQEAHHITKVMRAKVSDNVEIINGKNKLAKGSIKEISSRHVTVEIEKIKQGNPPSFLLALHCALPHPSKLDFIIEKATELGVNEIHLFTGEKSKKIPFSDEKKQRAKKLCIAALKQSGRLILPTVYYYDSIYDYPQIQGAVFYGEMAPVTTKFPMAKANAYHIFIGPESGLTEKEMTFIQKTLNGKPFTLNPYTLRAETAAICAVAVFNYLLSLE